MANMSLVGVKTQTKVVEQQRVETKAVKTRSPPLDLRFVIDKSSSMSGQPIEDCKASVNSIFDALRPSDAVSVKAFNSHPPCPVTPLARKRDIEALGGLNAAGLSGLRAHGGTALWDAVCNSIAEVASNKATYDKKSSGNKMRRCKVVLLTDGADMHSSSSFAAACEKVAKPGCVVHFILIAVGVDGPTLRQLEKLCEPMHAKLVNVQDATKISDAFHSVKVQLVKEITTTRTVVQKTVHTSTGKGKSGAKRSRAGAGGGRR